MHLIQWCLHGLWVAAVWLQEDCVCGNVGSVEISWACILPLVSVLLSGVTYTSLPRM